MMNIVTTQWWLATKAVLPSQTVQNTASHLPLLYWPTSRPQIFSLFSWPSGREKGERRRWVTGLQMHRTIFNEAPNSLSEQHLRWRIARRGRRECKDPHNKVRRRYFMLQHYYRARLQTLKVTAGREYLSQQKRGCEFSPSMTFHKGTLIRTDHRTVKYLQFRLQSFGLSLPKNN